jgi:hypothetical protein
MHDERGRTMAVAGETLLASARSSAMAFVRRVAGDGHAAAAAMPDALATAHTIKPTLIPMSGAQIDDFNAFLQHTVVWENDMNCFARASLGARHVNEVLGHGLTPADDAFNAAVAILEAPPGRGWSFHAGIAVKDEHGETWIIDHLTDDAPNRLKDWSDAYGVSKENTYVVSPFAGSKVKSNTTDPQTWSWIERALNGTWKHPAKYGVQVRGWGR